LIVIKNSNGETENYKILNIFPFSSETKRMVFYYFYFIFAIFFYILKGIIVKFEYNDLIMFYLKGADVVMK
jgi:magnesium-transporting ATPase (P-type)